MDRTVRERVLWTPGDWGRLTEVGLTTPTNTYDATEDAADETASGLISWVSGAEGNDRRARVMPPVRRNGRLRTAWLGHTQWGLSGGQIGQVHRLVEHPDGSVTALVIYTNFTFAQDDLVTVGVWEVSPAGVLSIGPDASNALTGIAPALIDATDASRTSNVVTATGLPDGHGLAVDDQVTVNFTDGTYDGSFTITATTSTTASWAQTAADDPSAGAGTIDNLDDVLPILTESLVDGDTAAWRAWRQGDPRPDWSDSTRVVVLTDSAVADLGPGRHGLYHGHIDGAGGFARWGAVQLDLDPT